MIMLRCLLIVPTPERELSYPALVLTVEFNCSNDESTKDGDPDRPCYRNRLVLLIV